MDVHGGEDGFRSLVEKVADYAIFMMDLEGRPSTWNEGVRRTLGFEEAEFVGHDVLGMIFTSQDVAAGIPRRELERAAQAGTASNDRWMRRKDGSTFFALGITVARRDAAGNLVG